MIVKIKASGVMTFSEDQSWLSLANMQGFVEGYIEIIQLSRTTVLVVNEEGRLKALDSNIGAFFILKDLAPDTSINRIFGNAILVSHPHIIE